MTGMQVLNAKYIQHAIARAEECELGTAEPDPVDYMMWAAVGMSHEALRERVTELERLIRAHGDAQATLRNELDFAGVSLDLSEHYERADVQLRAEAEAWHE